MKSAPWLFKPTSAVLVCQWLSEFKSSSKSLMRTLHEKMSGFILWIIPAG